jgi:hypothetical protein
MVVAVIAARRRFGRIVPRKRLIIMNAATIDQALMTDMKMSLAPTSVSISSLLNTAAPPIPARARTTNAAKSMAIAFAVTICHRGSGIAPAPACHGLLLPPAYRCR